MATGGIQIPNLNWEAADQTKSFREWKSLMESYFVINKVDDKLKWHYLLLSTGSRGHELWESWALQDAQKEDVKHVFEAFENHLIGTPNKWVVRLELNGMMQHDDEAVDDFICRLKAKASQCQFLSADACDEMITFQLIRGITWTEEQKTLISKGNDLKMDAAIKSARSYQATIRDLRPFKQPISTDVHTIQKKRSGKCEYCGWEHAPQKCPAYGKRCKQCGKKNHFERVCRQKQTQDRDKDDKAQQPRKINIVEDSEQYEPEDAASITFSELRHNGSNRTSIMAVINIRPDGVTKRATLLVKVDTGANGNILPFRCLQQMFPIDPERYLEPSNTTLTAVNGTDFPQMGCISMPIQFDNTKWYDACFYVCKTDGPAILSCQLSEQLKIVSVKRSCNISVVRNDDPFNARNSCNTLMSRYPACFRGIGNLPGEFHIELQSNAIPYVATPRKYPIQLREEICNKLKEMESMDVIEKCDDSIASEWVNSIAFARKSNGEIRVCLDPKHLNSVIKRTYHRAPTVEEISYKLHGATVFSKLDAKHGYWGVKLNAASSELCTFNSPRGKYRFKRLPFGLSVSQDIFQKHMDDIIRNAGQGVIGIADDFVVYGTTTIEHDDALHRLMRSAEKHGLVFRAEKCKFSSDEVKFFGLRWSAAGMQPDPDKCDQIKHRRAPENVKELQSFLGMLQYMSQFIPHLSDKTRLLRELCKKDKDWIWSAEHQKCFDELREVMNKDMQLRYFDPKQAAEIEVDASAMGLGAALIQETKPIAFSSKALTATETRYANIERELLAVVHGLEKFHTYIYGRPITVYSDHKPLENIQLKQLSQAPPRLQRMLMRIQPYEATIVYRPGKEMVYADYLSRIAPRPGPEITFDHCVHTIQISDGQLDKVRHESKEDKTLAALSQQIVHGWPSEAKEVKQKIRQYWSMRDQLTVEDGLVFTGNRLIVPQSLRKEFLKKIHFSHLGQTKSILRAKESVFWPGMTNDIRSMVEGCDICLRNAKSARKEPMVAHETPSGPWESLHTDILELKGHKYMLVADQFSKMPFVRQMKNETSTEAIRIIKEILSVHGVPMTIFSDNGPQYSSREFKEFAKEWDFRHITSSPRYPQSNGFIERMVGFIKPTLQKAAEGKTDPLMAMLCLRGTPIDSTIPSPAELLYGRKIRTNMLIRSTFQRQHWNVRQRLDEKSTEAGRIYNKGAGTEKPELSAGQDVMIQRDDKTGWVPGRVEEACSEPRSYLVRTENDRVVRRNRRFLIGNRDAAEPEEVPVVPVTETGERPKRSVNKPKRYIEEC